MFPYYKRYFQKLDENLNSNYGLESIFNTRVLKKELLKALLYEDYYVLKGISGKIEKLLNK